MFCSPVCKYPRQAATFLCFLVASIMSVIPVTSCGSASAGHTTLDWRARTPYNRDEDWLFASPEKLGQQPYWPDSALRKAVRPGAVRAGIVKHIGWHTFRHSFATLLKANGEDVKVVQESLRHANSRITLDVYTQGLMPTKRRAQGRVVKSLLAPNGPPPATSVAASA